MINSQGILNSFSIFFAISLCSAMKFSLSFGVFSLPFIVFPGVSDEVASAYS